MTVRASASGRVNLIGEHTDYNGGFVLPMLIPVRTTVMIRPSRDRIITLRSDASGMEPIAGSLDDPRARGLWSDYVVGVAETLMRRGMNLGGFDAHVASEVPVGAGLASSAALLVATVRGLREAFALEIFAMAALGVENFHYVEKLQQRGIDAIGLSGISGRLLVGKKKDVRAVRDGKTMILRDDYTGTVDAVNLPLLTQFLGPGRVPVVAPLALSMENEALNVDGDRVAARIAVAIDADALLILTNVPGLLRDVHDPSSLVAEATLAEAEELAQGRMKKKILAAREALEAGVDEVVIRSATGDPAIRTVIRA